MSGGKDYLNAGDEAKPEDLIGVLGKLRDGGALDSIL